MGVCCEVDSGDDCGVTCDPDCAGSTSGTSEDMVSEAAAEEDPCWTGVDQGAPVDPVVSVEFLSGSAEQS